MWDVSQRCGWFAVAAAVGFSAVARADDEIQVYNGEMADVGKWTAQHHLNYAILGRKTPEFPGGLIPNRTLNGTGEYAVGVTNWFEFGFYTPYAFDKDVTSIPTPSSCARCSQLPTRASGIFATASILNTPT
jgi:hypothetical protein